MPGFQRVGSVSDFSEGLVRVFPVDGVEIAVVKHEGEFYAFSGRCPHANYLMNYTRIRPGDMVLCSSHFALFELKTGKVVRGPADEDLTCFDVRIDGEDVLVSAETSRRD